MQFVDNKLFYVHQLHGRSVVSSLETQVHRRFRTTNHKTPPSRPLIHASWTVHSPYCHCQKIYFSLLPVLTFWPQLGQRLYYMPSSRFFVPSQLNVNSLLQMIDFPYCGCYRYPHYHKQIRSHKLHNSDTALPPSGFLLWLGQGFGCASLQVGVMVRSVVVILHCLSVQFCYATNQRVLNQKCGQ